MEYTVIENRWTNVSVLSIQNIPLFAIYICVSILIPIYLHRV